MISLNVEYVLYTAYIATGTDSFVKINKLANRANNWPDEKTAIH